MSDKDKEAGAAAPGEEIEEEKREGKEGSTGSGNGTGAAWDAYETKDGAAEQDWDTLKALPYRKRLSLYLGQRFPLIAHGLLIFSYFSANQFLAQAVTTQDKMSYGPSSWLNFALLFSLFFHLRVFDEHKDREKDLQAYPDRYLSRGVMTYSEIWRLGLVAIGLELILAFVAGPAALLTWGIVLLWTLMMFKEFFMAEWLTKHIFLYAISHTTIMFMFDMLIWSVTTRRWIWQADYLFVIYAFNGVFMAFTFEFARKIRLPEDEHASVDSYSKHLGLFGAAYLVLAVMFGATFCTCYVGWALKLHWGFFLALGIALTLVVGSFGYFRLKPSRKSCKMLEVVSSLYIIFFDFCLIFALIAKKGITLKLFG